MMGNLRYKPLLLGAFLLTALTLLTTSLSIVDAGASETTNVDGAWSQDEGKTTRARNDGSGMVSNVTINYVWKTGTGIGTSFGNFDIRLNPDGTGSFRGFELFVGRMGGRSGTLTLWNEGKISNFSDYEGTGRSLTGTEELENAHLEGSYVGKVAQGGHWTGGTLTFR